MMKTIILGMMAVLVMTVSANALIVAENTFTSYTNGDSPNNPTLGNTGAELGGNSWVINPSGTGTATALVDTLGGNQYLHIVQDANTSFATAGLDWHFSPSVVNTSPSGVIQFELQLLSDVATDAIFQIGDLNGGAIGGPHIGIRGSVYGGGSPQSLNAGTSSPAADPALMTLTSGQWYKITIAFGPVDGTSTVTNMTFYVGNDLVYSGTIAGVAPGQNADFGLFEQQGGKTASIGIDDIKFATELTDVLPEPASLSLLGVGSLLMLKRRRRVV